MYDILFPFLFLFLAVVIAVIISSFVSYAIVMEGVTKMVESLENEKQATSNKTSEGCEFCKGAKYIYGELSASGHVDADHDFVHEQYGDLLFCPMCGRRLEEVC